MKWPNIFRKKKWDIPCVCDFKDKHSFDMCLIHALAHGMNEKYPCKKCNYSEVIYQHEVKMKAGDNGLLKKECEHDITGHMWEEYCSKCGMKYGHRPTAEEDAGMLQEWCAKE